MRVPRVVRAESVLYVADKANPFRGGTSYIACGKVRRLVQQARP